MAGRACINGFNRASLPFMNFLKLAHSQQSTSASYAYPSVFDSFGYPSTTPSSFILQTVFIPSTYTGRWVLKWTGTGRFRIDAGTTVHSGSGFVVGATTFNMTVAGTNARVEFSFTTPDQSTIATYFPTGSAYSGMIDAILCRLADEASLDAGGIFTPEFLAIERSLNTRVLRMLEAVNVNEGCNRSISAYDATQQQFSYGADRWEPGCWAGALSGTDTYTCAAPPNSPAAWTNGEVIHAQVVNANTTGTITLNVGGRGAKTIRGMINFPAPAVGELSANLLVTFVYNAIADRVYYRPGGIFAATPISLCVEACNTLGVDLWLNLSHLYTDASIIDIATAVKNSLDPSLTFLPELSNEVWNFAGGFPQTSFMAGQGVFQGIGGADTARNYMGAYAKRAREIMGLITDVWGAGGSAPQLKRVMAFQAFGDTSVTNTYRFQGSDLATWGYNVAPDRPIDYSDVLSYATYFSGGEAASFDANYDVPLTGLLDAADGYDSGDPTQMAAALDWLDGDIRDGTGANEAQTMASLNATIYPAWETLAASYGKDVWCYEGGLEIAAPSTSRLTALSIDPAYHDLIVNLYAAYKLDFRAYLMARDQFNQFLAQAHSEVPSWFLLAGPSQWSLLTGGPESTPYQTFYAVKYYNDRKLMLRLRTATS